MVSQIRDLPVGKKIEGVVCGAMLLVTLSLMPARVDTILLEQDLERVGREFECMEYLSEGRDLELGNFTDQYALYRMRGAGQQEALDMVAQFKQARQKAYEEAAAGRPVYGPGGYAQPQFGSQAGMGASYGMAPPPQPLMTRSPCDG